MKLADLTGLPVRPTVARVETIHDPTEEERPVRDPRDNLKDPGAALRATVKLGTHLDKILEQTKIVRNAFETKANVSCANQVSI